MRRKIKRAGRQADSYKDCLSASAGCGPVCLSVCQVIKSLVRHAARGRQPAIINKLPLTFIEQRHTEEERSGGWLWRVTWQEAFYKHWCFLSHCSTSCLRTWPELHHRVSVFSAAAVPPREGNRARQTEVISCQLSSLLLTVCYPEHTVKQLLSSLHLTKQKAGCRLSEFRSTFIVEPLGSIQL